MTGFYMKCKTGLKWIKIKKFHFKMLNLKNEDSERLNLSDQNYLNTCFKTNYNFYYQRN